MAFIIVIISLSLMIYISIYMTIYPKIKEIGKNEMDRFNQLVITHCYLTNETIYDDVINVNRDNQGRINYIDIDMIKLNGLANDVVLDIEKTYDMIEQHHIISNNQSYYEKRINDVSKKGIITQIPLTSLLKVPLFNFISPSVTIKFKHLSQVSSSIVKNIENYGMNHIMVEINLEVTLKHTMTYPFYEEYNEQVIQIPLLLELYQGQLPTYYLKGEL